MDAHSIKKLLNNMFIAGFQGENPSVEIQNAIKDGLGGVIFLAIIFGIEESLGKLLISLNPYLTIL